MVHSTNMNFAHKSGEEKNETLAETFIGIQKVWNAFSFFQMGSFTDFKLKTFRIDVT